jgi:hypothetical protein
MMDKVPQEDCVSFSDAVFSLLDFLTFEIGAVGCPETSVKNYYYLLRNTPEERRSHMMMWQCRLWFGSIWSGSE